MSTLAGGYRDGRVGRPFRSGIMLLCDAFDTATSDDPTATTATGRGIRKRLRGQPGSSTSWFGLPRPPVMEQASYRIDVITTRGPGGRLEHD